MGDDILYIFRDFAISAVHIKYKLMISVNMGGIACILRESK